MLSHLWIGQKKVDRSVCSGLKWSNDQHVCLLHVCRLMITWPVEYVGMCLERCARSGVPPLAKPIRGFFAATVHFGRFLLSLPFARPRPQNRWHPWRIANRSLHHACVLYGLPLSRLTAELHHTSMFCVMVGMDVMSELLFFWGDACAWIQYGQKGIQY